MQKIYVKIKVFLTLVVLVAMQQTFCNLYLHANLGIFRIDRLFIIIGIIITAVLVPFKLNYLAQKSTDLIRHQNNRFTLRAQQKTVQPI